MRASLTKQPNIYGFRRAAEPRNATEPASYEHEFFKKGRPIYSSKVKRASQDKAVKPRGKRPFYGNQFTREVDNTAVLPEIGAPLSDAPHEAITSSEFSDKPARLGGHIRPVLRTTTHRPSRRRRRCCMCGRVSQERLSSEVRGGRDRLRTH